MNEFNFFETKEKSKKIFNLPNLSIGYKLAWLIFCLITFVLVFLYFQFSARQKEALKEIDRINNEIIKLQSENNLQEIAQEQIYDGYTKEDLQFALDEIILIKEESYISADVVSGIRESMPDTVFLTSIQVERNNIRIDGYTNTSQKIAQFQYQLGQLDSIESVFVPNMLEDLGSYSFTVVAEIKGENNEEFK